MGQISFLFFKTSFLLLTGFMLAFFLYAGIISLLEREKRAAKRFFIFVPFLVFLFILPKFISHELQVVLYLVFVSMIVLVLVLFFLPLSADVRHDQAKDIIDERDIMFSRNLLVPGTERYNEYYKSRPQHLVKDELFRSSPGLLSSQAFFYHPYTFAAAQANFDAVALLKPLVYGKSKEKTLNFSKEELGAFIKGWAKKSGAHSTGFTELKSCHLYSHKGRGDRYGEEIVNTHKHAIAFTYEMDECLLDSAPQGGATMESSQQYLRSGMFAIQLAVFLRESGYEASAHIDGNYELICPLVAKDAGLGEIGRMGLLMTPDLGPRVRIAVVTTNAPLPSSLQVNDTSMIDFCGICKKCARVCPSNSIPFDKRREINGVLRWKINSEACFTYWCKVGTDCGRCISVCPFSHPDNFLHRIVRFGIKKSYLFRRFALVMDDFFYGKRPLPKKYPKWISL